MLINVQGLKSRKLYKFEAGRNPGIILYKKAKESFVIVHTGETALYGNIILTKGIIKPEDIEGPKKYH